MNKRLFSRRTLLLGGSALLLGGGIAFKFRRRLRSKLSQFTQSRSFSAVPELAAHDPARDRTQIAVAQGQAPAANVDRALEKLGGMQAFVGTNDVVIIKVSAQWWNQGMTNVASARRVIEQVLELPGFSGEIIVFENTHFRTGTGSGLSRAWSRASERNVDVPGWSSLGALIPHFEGLGAPVSFVGLVDGGESELAGAGWHDPTREHGIYGGDGRGPIPAGDPRDGYHWDFDHVFRLKKSFLEDAQTPLTWPRFSSPRTGIVVDLRDGLFTRDESGLTPVSDRTLTWINITTANEHPDTGFTGACKSTMGVVDMSAGRMGTHALVQDYQSVHYFGHGHPNATWRMAGPLADFARNVRRPNLIIAAAEWVAYRPAGFGDSEDHRQSARSCANTKTVVAGVDPVAIDTWCCRNLLAHLPSEERDTLHNLDNPDAKFTKFLRYYREVWGRGCMDPALIDVV